MELCFHGFSHYARKILIIIMLWHTGIRIHFVVLMEPQSLENCAFYVHVRMCVYYTLEQGAGFRALRLPQFLARKTGIRPNLA